MTGRSEARQSTSRMYVVVLADVPLMARAYTSRSAAETFRAAVVAKWPEARTAVYTVDIHDDEDTEPTDA